MIFSLCFSVNYSFADCDLDEVFEFVEEKNYSVEKIRVICENEVTGLGNCSIYKIVKLIRDDKSKRFIEENCED
jgi:hypothetical protein